MEANIEEPLTTDEIAQHVCVSRRQLERIFKQYLNRVPSQYYLELRLNKARQMLMQTSKSIIQIGLSCGFSSGPHFSSAYRNFFGATPRRPQPAAQQQPVRVVVGAVRARLRWRPAPPWPPACWVASARLVFVKRRLFHAKLIHCALRCFCRIAESLGRGFAQEVVAWLKRRRDNPLAARVRCPLSKRCNVPISTS
jgi:AraC-like DNA-binding protein